ncbi:type 1 glutamine amidotransferase [Cumulibacter manganitolerans]|uniref:type 1 glutamine amidotransferase n=1 Tax=Cumulibacter manganitolerans TaxID=1884992 RepID=UPI001297CA3B|nr:type 1 glutamine amidotransferase [Cumulibacter manganitolerans]
MTTKPFAFIEHDKTDPPGPLLDWLTEHGYECVVIRPYAGDPLPDDLTQYAGTIVLGGGLSATSDKGFPWRSQTLEMLQRAAATSHPTLAICLGAQLVTQALGGRVERGSEGMEIGPMLSGRKDVSYKDELFETLPMAPDVIQFHGEVIAELPPGAVHLMGGPLYDHQAFRFGDRMWATQFHFETTHETFRSWIVDNEDALQRKGFDTEELVRRSEIAHPDLREVWEPFIVRFAQLATEGPADD